MRKFFLLMIALGMSLAVNATDNDKLSISTQMFLDEQAGKISFEHPADFARGIKAKGITDESVRRYAKYDRPIAKAFEKDGKKVVSAFIRVDDSSVISELEALGVEIECEFLDGKLYTTLIPVDKIEKVSELVNVKKISVATMMRPLTNMAREYSNVDDVITYSNDARSAGLPNAYDGNGVLLGVIDTGIDFQHKAFKDASGNTRLKRAYVVTSSGYSYSAREYGDGASYSITSTAPTTDDSTEDHGTHTSSTAGGSSVVISGSNTTVTTDHANATYGGMAPGANLFLAGMPLADTYISNAFQKMCNYADSKGMPVVISNSWGSGYGPRDGTGDFAEICEQYFGDNNPNHICLFAASNDAGTNGFHVMGTSSSSSPLGTVMNYNSDYGLSYYYGDLAVAWTRSTGVTLNCKIIVINSSGSKVAEVSVNPSSSGSSVSLSSYGSGSIYAYRSTQNGKSGIRLSTSNSGFKANSGYKLAVQFYPSSGSSIVDVWSGAAYTYFTSTPSTSGYTWTAGSDNMCVSDEATIPTAISIGAYSTKTSVKDYANTNHNLSEYTLGDIAYFSSWASASASPTGLAYPWICAPGATVVSAVNHYDTSGDYSYLNGNSAQYGYYRVNTDTSNPYGSMEGTSMATPAAAGIVALWLQVAKDNNIELTTSDIKTIMKESAIKDSFVTTGANSAHFGNGKIDALAGIKYILDNYVQQSTDPTITANPTSINFGSVTAGGTATQTFNVQGANLEGNISLAVSGNGYSISATSVTSSVAQNGTGATITVTFKPTAGTSATYNGTVTLTSSNANSVTVSLTGNGVYTAPALSASPTSLTFTGNSGQTYTKTVKVTGTNLQGNVTAAINGNSAYTVSPTTITQAQAAAGYNVTVTWAPTAGGSTTANLVFSTTGTGANSVTVPITGTAQGPSITVTPASVAFEGYVGDTYTKTFNVKGTNLSGNVSITKSGSNVFSVTPTTITAANANSDNGVNVTVTYAPNAAGNATATLTVASSGASSQTVELLGAAQEKVPTLTVDPASLSFSANASAQVSKTFNVTGKFLNSDVTLTLTDPSGVFAVSPATISASSISEDTPVQVTVTFNSADEGNFNGSILVASEGAESMTVQLAGVVSNGGTASDAYLNIAKYATIDEAGASVNGMQSIYSYNEYADQGCAWLTVSNYGAMQAASTQQWIENEITKSSVSSWNATDIFLGDDSYFGSNTSYSAYWNSDAASQYFYVTNCSQVKQLAYNRSNSTFKLYMRIYECTLNDDGSITASTTAFDEKANSNTNATEVTTSATLDPAKIYKVQIYNDYSDLYEIAFKTPINQLDAPVATEATEVGVNEFTAHWTACDDATSYTLRVMPKPEISTELLISEDFSKFTIEGSTDLASSLDDYMQNAGWTGSRVYEREGGLQLGSNSYAGSLVSPSLDLSKSGGKVTVKFNAYSYSSNYSPSTLYVSMNGSTTGQQNVSVPYGSGDGTEYTIVLDCNGNNGETVNFRTDQRRYRVVLTNVEIYSGDITTTATPALKAEGEMLFPGITDTEYTVTGLEPETTYIYDVKAVYGDKESNWSNQIEVTTLAEEAGTTLAEILASGVNGTEYTVSDDLAVVDYAEYADNAFLTDGDGNWIMVTASEDIFAEIINKQVIKGGSLKATLSGIELNPVLTASAAPSAGSESIDYEIAQFNLADTFNPQVNQVIDVTGYWQAAQGNMRAYSSGGQSMTLNTTWGASSNTMESGKRYTVRCAMNIKEAWKASAGIMPKDYDYDFQNYIGYALRLPSTPTAINSIGVDSSEIVNVYNVQGMLLKRDVKAGEALQGLPRGIYIVGNKKVIVK